MNVSSVTYRTFTVDRVGTNCNTDILVSITRASIEDMSEDLWLDLSRYPNEWEQRPDAWRDVVTWVIPEQDWLFLVLKWPLLLDLPEI